MEVRSLKFRLKKGKGSVQGFTDAKGMTYLPGDIVDLPKSYLGERWLEPVKEEPKPEVPAAKIEPEAEIAPEATPEVPLPAKKSKKTK